MENMLTNQFEFWPVVLENVDITSFLACGNFRRLLITSANGLDPDQDRQNVAPDLDPNLLTH